jgi:hypothetical protein
MPTSTNGPVLDLVIRLAGEPLGAFSKVLVGSMSHWSAAARPVQTQGYSISLDGATDDTVASQGVPGQV